jgi:hypothetical protein
VAEVRIVEAVLGIAPVFPCDVPFPELMTLVVSDVETTRTGVVVVGLAVMSGGDEVEVVGLVVGLWDLGAEVKVTLVSRITVFGV